MRTFDIIRCSDDCTLAAGLTRGEVASILRHYPDGVYALRREDDKVTFTTVMGGKVRVNK